MDSTVLSLGGFVKSIWQYGLTSNELKIIGAISMFLDHLGYIVYPEIGWLRVIGRLAFPIFSFFVYQGAKYTRNRRRYLGNMFCLGVLCMLGSWLLADFFYGNILITFSLSLLLIYNVQNIQKAWHATSSVWNGKLCMWVIAFVLLLFATAILCQIMPIDYGFIGILVPVGATIADRERCIRTDTPIPIPGDGRHELINRYIVLAVFGMMLYWQATTANEIQYFSLIALLPLCFYNYTRGSVSMKHFFYWFYPLHFIIVEAINNMVANYIIW